MMTSMVSIILGIMLMIVQNPGYINKPAAVTDPTVSNPTDFESERNILLDHLDNINRIDETKNGETTQITTEIPFDTDFMKLNQYSRFDQWGLGYDRNGNLTQKSTQKMFYNYRNQDVRVTDVNTTTENKYDALGRRLQKIVTIGSQTKTENYYYAGHQVVEVRDENDQVKRQFIYGNGIDEVVRMDAYNGSTITSYYLHTNELGSTTAVTDANGNVVERYKYGLYGKPIFMDAAGNIIPKSAIGNNILFQGREYEPETNFYYFRARHYDPIMGRFLQVDPMGYEDSLNLYQAFGMNPVNFVDPFGEDVLGACADPYKHYLYPTENKEIIEAQNRSLALVSEGAANAAVKTFLLPAKYITLPARLMFGFDFDVSLNFTEEGSVVNADIGKRSRIDIVKEQTVVYPLADFATQTSHDVYFGLFYQGGNSPLGESSRENLARSAGALEFNTLFWGNVSKSIINQRQAIANSISGQENINISTKNNYVPESLLKGKADAFAYLGVRNEEPVYTGVTKNPIKRAAQHGDRFELDIITNNPLTRRQARAIEQVIIENNPQFENIISSIGKYRRWYGDAVTWGEKWLKENGFEWLLK